MNKSIFLIAILLMIGCAVHTTKQPTTDFEIILSAEHLKFVRHMPYICKLELGVGYGCGDKIYWDIIQYKKAVVPILIEKISDERETEAVVRFFGANYAVGDIAYSALKEIVHGIPTFELLGVEFDEEGCGYCAYWNHLKADVKHREQFEQAVRNWYKKHERKLVWVESEAFEACDCQVPHPNGGHYELKK